MKIVLITSDINYCPDNYDPVLRSICKRHAKHIAAVVLMETSRIGIIKIIPVLKALSCKNLLSTLLKNIQSASKKKAIFKDHNIPIIYTKNPNEKSLQNFLKDLQCDILINLRSRAILGKSILNIPKYGCINLHHGLLPQQRGLFCDLHAIDGREKTGLTIHQMTEELDYGMIYKQKFTTADKDYIKYLYNSFPIELELINEFIADLLSENKLPAGKNFAMSTAHISGTPSIRKIREFQENGLIL